MFVNLSTKVPIEIGTAILRVEASCAITHSGRLGNEEGLVMLLDPERFTGPLSPSLVDYLSTALRCFIKAHKSSFVT